MYFARNSVTLNQLKDIKSLQNVIVKWSPYVAGPTQCNNCQLYGHGNKHCHLTPRCLICGNNHTKANCPKALGHHYANDPRCSKRTEYINMRLATSTRNYQKSSSNVPNVRGIVTSRTTASSSSSSATINQRPIPTRITSPTSDSTPRPSYENILSSQPEQILHSNEDLFTAEELIELTMTLITDLSRCRTKDEQIRAVSNLAIKFVYTKYHGP